MLLLRRAIWVCVLLLAACRSGPVVKNKKGSSRLAPELTQISDWEDRRSLGDGKLTHWAVGSADVNVRERAFLALARIQDPTTADAVIRGLVDPAPPVRRMAAFAAGELALAWEGLETSVQQSLTSALLEVEHSERDPEVGAAQLEALSRLATPEALARLTARLSHSGPTLQARAATGLGVAAKRGAALPQDAFSALSALVRMEGAAETRIAAAYALAMSKSLAARPTLLTCLADGSAEVRTLCAKGLAETALETDSAALGRVLEDADYRVAVEATRALARLADRCKGSPCPPVDALKGLFGRVTKLERGDVPGGAQPLLALAQQGLPPAGASLLRSLRAELVASSSRSAPQRKKDFANLDCRFAAALDGLAAAIAESLQCGGGLISERQRLVTALRMVAQQAPKSKGRAEPLLAFLTHSDPSVRAAALDAIASQHQGVELSRLRPLLGDPDAVVAGTAASALGRLHDEGSIPGLNALASRVLREPDLADPVATALASLKPPGAEAALRTWLESPEPSVRLSAANALETLTGKRPALPRVERPRAEPIEPLPTGAQIQLRTEKGNMTIALFAHDAPRTAANLHALAQRGYLKGVGFHRIVPDFVVQGGDPRGDGEGGPGYRIRCEVNLRPYVRRTVGMALSGKDTGGSQFFVALSPQPHLDGRYTVFGEVVVGEDVLDTLLEGDQILEARALP